MKIVDVTSADGEVAAHEWLVRAERVHRELRPQLPGDYAAKLARVFAGGARMVVATEGDQVLGVALYRIHENTFAGLQMYVDDLVTAEALRSTGVGHALMEHLQNIARAQRCDTFALDSGAHRTQAHKFYFREGMVISSFHFGKKL